jgi:4a-hydroxytetrahydrobiopterin dehydratase
MTQRQLLTAEDVEARLRNLPGWQLKNGRLHRELTFGSFVEAFGFLTSLALVAERMNHHPDIHNVYNWVSLTLWTHDANGLTALDFTLAQAAEQLPGVHAR